MKNILLGLAMVAVFSACSFDRGQAPSITAPEPAGAQEKADGADDGGLPRVLVIGDSISMNYHDAVGTELEGIADYYRIEGNASSSARGVENIEKWLGDYDEKGSRWDVVQFNHGLHDLRQNYDAETDSWSDYAISLDEYKRNLEREIAILKKTGAKLIWCTATPIPNSNKGKYARRRGAAEVFNQAALEIMRKHPEIQINDLYRVVSESDVFDRWRNGKDVHFRRPEEQAVLGAAVAQAIETALQ